MENSKYDKVIDALVDYAESNQGNVPDYMVDQLMKEHDIEPTDEEVDALIEVLAFDDRFGRGMNGFTVLLNTDD